ncbi:hypothetical protein GQ43DRAFT_275822 [Delitschia confertaspora ATCC 74209]|uniref:Uncharacterized protein n=1 Tax=Delitschia confertaspora ATCC 74209 TaxID=1513339 RepID=A0A9P4JBB4_9PLEO|nr:hypothetical protein GQ43DRAFT_275822 [Delitschia confertaspora ATCC 74209]
MPTDLGGIGKSILRANRSETFEVEIIRILSNYSLYAIVRNLHTARRRGRYWESMTFSSRRLLTSSHIILGSATTSATITRLQGHFPRAKTSLS